FVRGSVADFRLGDGHRGQRRGSMCGDGDIIIPYDGQVVRDAQTGWTRHLHRAERHPIVRRVYGLRRIGELEKSAHGRLPATESEVAIDHETAVELDTSDLQCSPKTAILIQATIAPTTGARERTRYHPDSGKALFDE